jgi:hypothetical protein
MPVIEVFTRADAFTVGGLAGTTIGPVTGSERVLYDQDDSTYIEVVGGLGVDTSALTYFSVTSRDSTDDDALYHAITNNATITEVMFRGRLDNGVAACLDSGFNAFVEVWGMRAAGDSEFQYGNVEFNSGDGVFDWAELVLPVSPFNLTWVPSDLQAVQFQFGLRARTDCFSSLTPQMKGVKWSEGQLRVSFRLAPPTLAIGAADALNPRGATVYGTITPNQVFSVPSTPYPVEYGFTIGSIESSLPPYVYYGSVSGETDPITVSHVYSGNLSPGVTWYYRLAARDVDGNVTESTIGSFTTPLTDAPQGVY